MITCFQNIPEGSDMSKAKLLITDGLSPEGLQMLEKSGLFEITFHKAVEKEALKGMLPQADALVIRSATKMTKDLIDCATKLKVIMRAGAGVDNVDVTHATQKKVLVLNCPGTNNNAVAELTLGFLLGLMREIPRATAGMKNNLWEKKDLVGFEASGRTIGLLGFGAIGALVGKACHALGMQVVVFDPRAAELKAQNSFVKSWASSVDEVFASADVVSLHLPLMDSTKNSIGPAQFGKMKKGSYFINASRGGIANEAALLEALNNGTLAGAALDVFDQEPTPADHPLVKHPRVICAPHIGAATKEAQHKVGLAAAHYLIQYYSEGTAPSAVNHV
jgi:D-3-phosphoglycerate dehydrogenase / 2-oxoglutarate reductase